MSIPEYIANLQRLKQLAVDNWGNLTEVERQVFDSSFDWLLDNLQIKKGEITVDEDLTKSMDEFLSAVVSIVNDNKGVESKVTSFLSDLKNIQKNNIAFHATTNNFNIDTAGVKEVQKTLVNEIINQYLGNGLNSHFAAPLRDNIFRNILSGANIKQVKEVLRNYILAGKDGSGKLGSYLNQTAIQAVDSYQGAINQELKKTFTFTGYIISGSLIETSSEQCVYAVENSDHGYLTFKQWETVLQIARENKKAKLIEGTTIDNLPINKLHWGCRHDFTPVIKKGDVQPLPPKEEKKVEPKVKVVPITEIKTISGAKDTAQRIIQENIGLRVNSVKVSKEVSLDQLKALIKKLQQLTSEYNISPTVKKDNGTDIEFTNKKTKRGDQMGVVVSNIKGDEIRKINFGYKTIEERGKDYDPRISFLLNYSRVDPDNVQYSTMVHEFGHVITTQHQQNLLSGQKGFEDFWIKIREVYIQYINEFKSMKDSGDNDTVKAINLGSYARTNLSEFLAEGFTEYKLRSNPSKYAKKVGLLIDKYFKK